MQNSDFNKVQFVKAIKPGLQTGEYKITINQSTKSPVVESFPSTTKTVWVAGPRFKLDTSLIYSVYPPADSFADYGKTLPHIVFTDQTLPWQGGKGETPWLALICLSEGEEPDKKEMNLKSLVNTNADDSGVFFPVTKLENRNSEKETDICQVIDMPLGMFQDIMPKESDTAWLTHVKVVDLYEKDDTIIPLDGYFSVSVANRFPRSELSNQICNTVHLVSLAGYWDYLPQGAKHSSLSSYTTIRLVSLYSWHFYSIKQEYAGFNKIMSSLDISNFSIKTENPNINKTVAHFLNDGYTPLEHITRTGECTVSWYRGPFSPFLIDRDIKEKADTADGEIIYDRDTGMFDMSYASSWQLGRLLSLENRAIALAIFKWHRGILYKEHLRTTRNLIEGKLNTAVEKTHTDSQLSENHVANTFGDFCLFKLVEELTDGSLLGELADDGIQRSEIGEGIDCYEDLDD